MTPNWEAFQESLVLMAVATPFMFGVLSLFALTILGLSALRDPGEK